MSLQDSRFDRRGIALPAPGTPEIDVDAPPVVLALVADAEVLSAASAPSAALEAVLASGSDS